MPKQSYALEKGGPKRLEVSWKGVWKEITITLDGSPVGYIHDQKALSAGKEFSLPDRSTVKVQLVRKLSSTELQVQRNGQPLPGSASDPQTRLGTAYGIIYFVAGLNLILGLLSLVLKSTFLQELGIGFYSIIFGLIFFMLGFFVQRKSTLALILAIIIFAADALLGLITSFSGGYNPVAGLIARVILLIPMIQGVGAIKVLKQQKA